MILVNGDSWTGGRYHNGIPYKVKYWPDYLEDILNIKIINLARGGSSNNRIFRTTIDFLYSCQEPITHLIIGWSSPERSEISSNNGSFFQITPPQVNGDTSVPNTVKNTMHSMYYKWFHNSQTNLKAFLNSVLILQDLCQLRNIQLINFQSFNDNLLNIENFKNCDGYHELKNLHSQINFNNWLLSTMQQSLKDYPICETGHVNEAGNEEWAKILSSKFNHTF